MGLFRQIKDFIAEVKPVISAVETFSDSLETGTFDYEQPRTELVKMKDHLTQLASRVDWSKLKPLAEGCMRMLARPAVRARIREALREGNVVSGDAEGQLSEVESIKEDPRVQSGLTYLDELHKKLPYATFSIIANMPVWQPGFLWDLFELVRLRQLARSTAGERRARALKDLARHVTEHVHQRHVLAVEFAERLAGRLKPTKNKVSSYGTAIHNVTRGEPPARKLVHPDAATLRNAASHIERWHVDLEAETFVIQDGHDQVQERRYTFDELYAYCDELIEESLAFAAALATHAVGSFTDILVNTQLLDIILAEMGGESFEPSIKEQEFQKLAARFEPLKARLAAMKA